MRILSLDLGEKKIGVALSDETQNLATPLGTIERKCVKEDIEKLRELTEKYNIGLIIMGCPLNVDGTKGIAYKRSLLWSKRIKKFFKESIIGVDERYTTIEAKEILSRKVKKRFDDNAIAAAIILMRYITEGEKCVVERW